MKRRSLLRSTLLCAGVLLGAVACGSSDSGNPGDGAGGTGSTQQNVEIFSWWIAPGEAEAFQALVDLNKTLHPKVRVFNAAADSGTDARAKLAERMTNNQPPDLFQQNAHDISAFLQTHPDSLQPLDDFLDEQGLTSAIQADVLKDVTVDGHVYGMPVNIHRENSFFYNKQIFQDNGISPPNSTRSTTSCPGSMLRRGPSCGSWRARSSGCGCRMPCISTPTISGCPETGRRRWKRCGPWKGLVGT